MTRRENTAKLWITVTTEFDEKFTAWSVRLGITKSQFGNMCLQAGLGSLVRAVAPEESFSPEQLIKIIQAAENQKVQLDFSDFEAKKV
jgi:hypothetical protein